jgi:N-ethylmaleimide reductase
LSSVNGSGLDSDPEATYSYIVDRLNAFKLAYIHIIEGMTQGPREVPDGFDLKSLHRSFNGLHIANNGYDFELAAEARRRNLADLIAFGRFYIANPDLVERLKLGARLDVIPPLAQIAFPQPAAGCRRARSRQTAHEAR